MFNRENRFENKYEVLEREGISFDTELGRAFDSEDINLQINEGEQFFLHRFSDPKLARQIIDKAKKFREGHPNVFNGLLLGNPSIEFNPKNGKLDIKAEQLRYLIYFAYLEICKEKNINPEQYSALSVAGVVYDKGLNGFYMSVRPKDSQEDPGKIDAPGGTLNPEKFDANPFETIKNRFSGKLGIESQALNGLHSSGVARIFSDRYFLYNINMLAEVEHVTPQVDEDNFAVINIDNIEAMLASDKLTSPAKAALLMALSLPSFKELGWGKEIVESYI